MKKILKKNIRRAEPIKVIEVQWGCDKVGWGQLHIFKKKGKLYLDDECMGKGFVKKILCKMVDDCILKR